MANTMRATYLTRAMTAPSISSMTLVVLASIAESMSVVVIVASSKTDNDGYGVAVDDATAYGGCYALPSHSKIWRKVTLLWVFSLFCTESELYLLEQIKIKSCQERFLRFS